MSRYFTSTDIAERFNVNRSAVSNWRKRYGTDSAVPFPTPDITRPQAQWRLERWGEVERWNIERGAGKTGTRHPAPSATDRRSSRITVADIAERFGMSRRGVHLWRTKPLPTPFPAPRVDGGARRRLEWDTEQWPDIEDWHRWYMGHLAAARQIPPLAHDRIGVADISRRLGVSQSAVHNWRTNPMASPFPTPRVAPAEGSRARTRLEWDVQQWPDIESWHRWYLTRDRSRADAADAGATPSNTQFLKPGNSTSASGTRQGRVVRPSVRRFVN